jgi:hypothetical protein
LKLNAGILTTAEGFHWLLVRQFPFVPIDYDPHPNWTSNRLAGSVIPEELFRSQNLLTIAFEGAEGPTEAQSILKTNEPGLG